MLKVQHGSATKFGVAAGKVTPNPMHLILFVTFIRTARALASITVNSVAAIYAFNQIVSRYIVPH